MDKKARFRKRLNGLRELLKAQNADAVRLTLQKNISWLIGGRTHVNIAAEPACCQFFVSQDECVLIANNIETRRLLEEEIGFAEEGGITRVEQWNWFDPTGLNAIINGLVSGKRRVVTDAELDGALVALRTKFDRDDLEQLREYGRLTADAVNKAAFDVERGDTEYKIAGKIAFHCLERGLDPIVNLVAADERIYSRKHPLPTGKSVDRYAMLVVCARKNGVVFSATRLVHFGPLSDSLRRLHRAVAEIDARVIDATRPGVTLAELYEKLKQFYCDAGYEQAYREHHQGGLTGYNSRERLALPTESLTVEAGQMYAWNPSLPGVKSEDTLLVGADHNEIITGYADFPQVRVKVGEREWERPDILIRQLI